MNIGFKLEGFKDIHCLDGLLSIVWIVGLDIVIVIMSF